MVRELEKGDKVLFLYEQRIIPSAVIAVIAGSGLVHIMECSMGCPQYLARKEDLFKSIEDLYAHADKQMIEFQKYIEEALRLPGKEVKAND